MERRGGGYAGLAMGYTDAGACAGIGGNHAEWATMKDDDFNTVRGILLAVCLSLCMWAALLLIGVLWAS